MQRGRYLIMRKQTNRFISIIIILTLLLIILPPSVHTDAAVSYILPDGCIVWQTSMDRYIGTVQNPEWSRDENAYVNLNNGSVVFAYEGTAAQGVMLKVYSDTGEFLRTSSYISNLGAGYFTKKTITVKDMILTEDNSLVIIGEESGTALVAVGSCSHGFIMKINLSDYSMTWVRKIEHPEDVTVSYTDKVNDIIETDLGYFVAGRFATNSYKYYCFIEGYDKNTGNRIYVMDPSQIVSGEHDEFFTLSKTSDGGFIAAGKSNSPSVPGFREDNMLYRSSSWDPYVAKHDGYIAKFSTPSDGLIHREMHKCYGTRGYDYIRDIEETSDGYVFFAEYDNDLYRSYNIVMEINGFEPDNTGPDDLYIQKINPIGESMWIKCVGSGNESTYNEFLDAKTNPDGTVSFVGIMGNDYNVVPGGDVENSLLGNNIWVATLEKQDPLDPYAVPGIKNQYVTAAYRYPYDFTILKPDHNDNYLSFYIQGIQSSNYKKMIIKLAKIISADLSVSLTQQTLNPKGGDKIDVNNIVANLGPEALASANVEITVTPLDAISSIVVTDSGSDTSSVNANIASLSLKNISTSSQRTTGIQIQTKEDFYGTITVQSSVSLAGGTDPLLTNNTVSKTITVGQKVLSCDNYIEAFYRENEKLGEYTGFITFGNNGPDMAVDSVVTCRLDKSTSLVLAYPDTYSVSKDSSGFDVVTWDVGNLASGYTNYIADDPTSYFKVVCALNPGIIRGTLLSNKLNITSQTIDVEEEADGSQNEKTVWFGVLPDLALVIDAPDAHIHTFTDDDYPYEYSVTLTNHGQKEAKDVNISVTVPDGLKSISYYLPDLSGMTHSYDAVEHKINIVLNTLAAGGSIKLRVTGEMHKWYGESGYKFNIDASAKAKSDILHTQYDLNCMEQMQSNIYRPDIQLTYSYLNDTEGQYLYVDNDSGESAKKKVRIDIENIGQGNCHEFYIDIKLQDPSDSFASMIATASSSNVQSVTKMDAEGKVYRVKISDPVFAFLGLTGTYSNSRTDDNKKAFVEFELTSRPAPYDFDTAIIQADPYYESIGYFDTTISAADSLNADPDITNSSVLIYLDFYHITLDHWALGSYILEEGSVSQQYNLTVNYENTAFNPKNLAELDITKTFDHMKIYESNSDVFELYIKYACSSLDIKRSASNKGILIENNEPVVPESHSYATYLKSYSSEIDPAVYASNTFEVKAKISFRLEGSDVTHQLTRTIEFSIPPSTPTIYTPETGQICNLAKPFDIIGFAMPGSEVRIYDSKTKTHIGTSIADETGKYQYICSGGMTSFYVKSWWNTVESNPSKTVTLTESDHCWCPQRSYWNGKAVNGDSFTFKFRHSLSGIPSTSNWSINGVYGFWDSQLLLYVNPDHDPDEVYVIADNVKYSYSAVVGNYYVFNIKSAHNVMIYVKCPLKEDASYGSVLIDPDGFVFDSGIGFSNVVPGARVTCMVYDPANTLWYEWPAHAYSSQVNPQIVNNTGYFAFFTPPGTYRLVVEGPSPYQRWVSPDIVVIADLVTQNIPYQQLPSEAVSQSIRVYPTGLKDASGADKTNITVTVNDVVEWISYPPDGATINEISALDTNPVIRVKSSVNAEQDISGFDSGMLMPYYTYRMKFKYPGIYTYSYNINNNTLTGTVTVTGTSDTTDTQLPSVPAQLQAQLDGYYVSLSWNASTDNQQVAGYSIYRRLTDQSLFTHIADTANMVYTDQSVSQTTQYQYRVCAFDSSMNLSHPSDIVTITSGEIPSAPQNTYNPYIAAISCNSDEGTTASVNADIVSGKAIGQVPEGMMISAISRAAYFGLITKKDVICFNIKSIIPCSMYTLSIEQQVLDTILNVSDSYIMVKSPIASIQFNNTAMDSINSNSINDTVNISISRLDEYNNRPVYEFNVSNSKGNITEFAPLHILITIPYELSDGEDPNSIVIYLQKEDGSLESVRGYYDNETKSVIIRTDHLSRFVIGCNSTDIPDVSDTDWYSCAACFVSARGIIKTDDNSFFKPDSLILPDMLHSMLLKAYCIEALSDKDIQIREIVEKHVTNFSHQLTRLELFIMLYEILEYLDELPDVINDKTYDTYKQELVLETDQKKAIDLLIQTGIIKGDGFNLMLTKNSTHAEFAQVLYNLLTR